ncbi:MAG: LysE family translocator [Flavobacteriales bacterium]
MLYGIINFSLFLISSLFLVILPGPDFVYVITQGVDQGRRAGVLAALGISFGLLIHTLLAAFGLSAIVHTSRTVYLILKYLGAIYLLYIGLRMLLKKTVKNHEVVSIDKKKRATFAQGILINIFNPKAIVTFMAFLPQFIHIKITHPTRQFLFLGWSLTLIAASWYLLMGYFSGVVGLRIKNNRTVQKGIRYFSGSIITALGLKLMANKD